MAKTLIMTVILLNSVASIATSQSASRETSTTTAAPTITATPTTTTTAPTTITAAPTTTTAAPTTTTAAPTTTTAAPTTITAAPKTTTTAPKTTTTAPKTTTTAPTATTTAPTTITAAPTTITAAPKTTTAAPKTTTTAPKTTTTAPTATTTAPTATTTAPTTTTTAPKTTTTAPKTTTTAPTTITAAPKTTTAAPTTTAIPTTTATQMTTTVAGGQTTTTGPTSVCASSPCLCGSTCEERANRTYVCLCPAGEAHGPQGCEKAKVFPGLLAWKTNYDPEMSDKSSQIFKKTSDKIIDMIDKEFENKTGYISSLVLELSFSHVDSKQSEARWETDSVESSLQIIFETTSDIKEETVAETMEMVACGNCLLQGSFTVKDLCGSDPCDETTTKCKPAVGSFECPCLDGYISTNYSARLCMACPSGYKAVSNTCMQCDFGRTGLNCEDERLFIVVIVSSVLGFLLVVALIALLVVVNKFKKTKLFRTKQEDIRRPFLNPSFAKGPLSSNSNGYYTWFKEPMSSLANSGIPRIPRANAINNWDNLEMTEQNNEQNAPFDDNQVDMVSFSQS